MFSWFAKKTLYAELNAGLKSGLVYGRVLRALIRVA